MAERLKRAREAAGLSQRALAEKAGVSVRMVQFYEQGLKDINRAAAMTVYKLARVLGVKMEDLLEL